MSSHENPTIGDFAKVISGYAFKSKDFTEAGIMADRLQPFVAYHDDELAQGFFARLGSFHADVSASRFCSFVDMDRVAFRNGSDSFIDLTAELSGVCRGELSYNTLRLLDDGSFLLRGETLDTSILRRTQIHYCPNCLTADANSSGFHGAGQFRQRWIWQLRPVIVCPIHCVALASIDSRYGADAFDLAKLIEQFDVAPNVMPISAPRTSGVLQNYVVNRMNGIPNMIPWLDDQGLSGAVRACEMIGSLLSDGPQAAVKDYTASDWSAVGDVGFRVCSQGTETIKDELHKVRVASGRRSGRTGPQAVFGYLYNAIKKSARTEVLGSIVDVVRDVIVENFSVNAGETVFGEVIPRRKVHSVSSLSVATNINKYRLFGLARSTGLIAKTVDRDAYNQLVFPAEEAERVIGRIANSIPQNQVMNFLGSSTTQVDHFVRQKFIESITPLIEEDRGQLRGNYNRDDLNDFLERACRNMPTIASEVDGYVSLSNVSRMRTDTGQVISWLLDGELPKTCLLQGVKRIDYLRFCCADVAKKIRENQEYDVFSLTSVSAVLGIPRAAVRHLISTDNGGPSLTSIEWGGSSKDTESTYFSRAEIEHFQEMYLTLGLIGRMFGINWNIARRVLKEKNVDAVCDPKRVGAEIYRRDEVLSIAPDLEAAQPLPKEGRYKRT